MTPQIRTGTNIVDIFDDESFVTSQTTGGKEILGPKSYKVDSVLPEYKLIGLQDLSSPEKIEVEGATIEEFLNSVKIKP